jgi:hypothetical protein
MEYLIGVLATFTIISIGLFFVFKNNKKRSNRSVKIRYSQSNIHRAVAPFIPRNSDLRSSKMTQSKKHDNKTNIKVIIIEDSAYWITDNTFYTAFMLPDGTVNKETTRVVDTMAMTSVELEKMLFIMDKLREGLNNDSGSAGH